MRPASPPPPGSCGTAPCGPIPDKLSLCYKTPPSEEEADKLGWAHPHSGQEIFSCP